MAAVNPGESLLGLLAEEMALYGCSGSGRWIRRNGKRPV